MEFREYLMSKFLEWEASTNKRQSMSAFARHLGIKQSAFGQWIAGNATPSLESCRRLELKLGRDVYFAAGLTPPDEPFPAKLRSALESARDTIISRGLVGDSPEAEKVIIDAMSAAGYRLIVTKDDPSTN